MTMSTSGSARNDSASAVTRAGSRESARALAGSFSRTRPRKRGHPICWEEMPAFSVRTRATPPPTTPAPMSPIFPWCLLLPPANTCPFARRQPSKLVNLLLKPLHVVIRVHDRELFGEPRAPVGVPLVLYLLLLVGGDLPVSDLLQHLIQVVSPAQVYGLAHLADLKGEDGALGLRRH